jgi:hypothetical protein
MITMYWVTGHTDIPGNALANTLAKPSTLKKLPTHGNTCSFFLRRVIRASRLQESVDRWMRHPAKVKNYIGPFHTKPDNIFTIGNCQF